MPLSSNYNASKWAMEGMSEALMYELRAFNIRLKIVEPGSIATNFAKNAVIVRKDGVGVYRAMIERRLANFQQRQGSQSDPGVVARVIYQAATDPSSRLRYLAGSDAKFAWTLRQVLPFSAFATILRRIAAQ
jgi:NAD(P)-dependent dehydrogenase (short-subunit alcohol dehydrogenase family)